MNTSKVAAALNTISLAFGELAEAITEQPETPPSGVGSAGRAAPVTGSPPATFSDGLPVEEPPLFPDGFEGSVQELPDGSVSYRPAQHPGVYTAPASTERDVVLGRCPNHDVPWTIKEGGVSKAGKSYSAFWRCAEKDGDNWCAKKPDKGWLRTHDPEKALAAA